MRYHKKGTMLCGFLEAGRDVTVKLIDISNDTLLNVTSDACTESQNTAGLYYFDTNNITDVFSEKEIVFVMTTDRGQVYSGKIVIEDDLVRIGYLDGVVYCDTSLSVNGKGTQEEPFNNIDDTIDYAEAKGIKNVIIAGDATISGSMEGMTIKGIGSPIIDMNGQTMDGSRLYQCKLKGDYTGEIVGQECVLIDGVSLSGVFEKCSLEGGLACKDTAKVLMIDCYSGLLDGSSAVVSVGNSKLGVRGYHGELVVGGCTDADSGVVVEMAEGLLELDNSNTDGTMIARGVCKFTDSTAGANVVDETIARSNFDQLAGVIASIPADVWAYTVRELTVKVGLTQEEHDKLMITSTRSDVYGANLL